MGALMRTIDWSSTPVGPVEHWPQSLRTSLSILLTTGFPMYIAWGPSFTQFYNDAYRPILGSTKHPRAMGISTRETFAEIWDIIGPMFADVMRGNSVNVTDFLLPLDRHGFAEECYFIYSYSPIREESGDVGGVLVTVTETTERVLGARRLVLLQELAVRTQNAASTHTACRIAAEVLATDPADLPFAMLYLLDERTGEPVLAGSAGPVDEATTADAWRLREVVRNAQPQVVECPPLAGVSDRSAQPARAFVLPVFVPGAEEASGVLVAGLSPRLLFDTNYRSFLELVAGHAGTAIASARALEQAQARVNALAEIDRAKTAFFSNISHEFRTPLTLMLGPMEEALAHGSLAGEDLETAYRNVLRLQKLVNALLDFSRIEAGRMRASFVPTDLSRFTAELAGMFESAFVRAGLRFSVRCAALDEPILVDRDMYEKIVSNLLSNALKFTFEGSIEVSLEDAGDHVELIVRDTGTGIAAEDLPRVFDRFHRIEGARARTHEGSGIGLALVSELAKLHGGTVRADSTLGAGTTFTVALPKRRTHLDAEPIGAAPEASAGAAARAAVEEAVRWLPGDEAHTSSVPAESAGGRAGRVLIVDDNADMRGYLCRVLAPHVEVEAVPDGIAALDAARGRPPDLVLTDVMMPRLDGFGLLRAIREDAALRSIPVIMLSARAGEESRVEGLQAGADDYLVKPFAPREVVARVRTHLELSRLRRDAERELARLEQFFEQAPAVVCVLSGPEHVHRLANPPYLETIGKRAVLGLPIRQVLPELEGQGVFEILDRVYARGQRFVGSEVPIKLDRGEGLVDTFWNLVYQPYRDPHGTVEGVVVFGFEITDHVLARRRAEELTQQLRVSEAQAAAASRAKDEFFAVLGHELRNPLAPILTALQIMRLRGVETTKEQLIIERQTQHMVRLVDDLLDVSRIARGKIELKKRRLEAAEVVARGLEVASPLLEQKQHRLELEVPRHGLALDGDLDRLAQVVGNLLTNAAKYTESGGQITVTAERSDGQILIRVKDTGIGIAPEMLPHVFDMFVQESQALDRSRGGLGLGLTITRNLVELHGGRIEARSAGRGSGAELLVWLPAAAGAHAGRDADRTRGDVAVGKPAGTHRVLVVDDNDDSAMLLAAALEHMGFTVAVAYDGPEALQVASTFDPDVALLDIGLPVMDGYELARRLQDQLGRTNRHDRLRLVALTGYGQDSDLQQSREAGFDAHLVKPVDMQEISAVITRLTRDAPSPATS